MHRGLRKVNDNNYCTALHNVITTQYNISIRYSDCSYHSGLKGLKGFRISLVAENFHDRVIKLYVIIKQ